MGKDEMDPDLLSPSLITTAVLVLIGIILFIGIIAYETRRPKS